MSPIQNPDLVANFAPWFTDLRLHGTEYSGTWPNYESFLSLPWANNEDSAKFLRKDAPWCTLQIQDPPVTTVVVERRSNDRGADMVVRETLLFPNGVTMATLYDLTWSHCGKVDTVFGVRWDGIPLPDGEKGKASPALGHQAKKWRYENFLPKLGGEEQVVLELYHGETWFLKNYISGMGFPETAVSGWERFKSEGFGKGEKGDVVGKESIPEQVY